MKTSRRSHLAALGASLAAFFGLSRKSAAAEPSATASRGPNGPNVVVSPDGRTRTYYNAHGEVVQTDRFDERGRLISSARMEGGIDRVPFTSTTGR